jgi:type VI secretion system protein VasD
MVPAKTHKNRVVAFALASCLTAGGCHNTPPPEAPKKCPPQKITVSILTSSSANPTPTGEPRPVIVHVYQLKNDERLFNASFEQMWHEDKETLTDDVIHTDQLEMYPATRQDLHFDRVETLQHIAAVALFQEPKGKSWFTSFDLPPLPEPGKCNEQACDEDDDDCATRAANNSHYTFWIDGSKLDDGVEHLDDFPAPGPMKKRSP